MYGEPPEADADLGETEELVARPLDGYYYLYFAERRHDAQSRLAHSATGQQYGLPAIRSAANDKDADGGPLHDWRMRERVKTVSILLTLCLNVGVDPPDVVKTSPCARLECWMDPFAIPWDRATEAVGRTLQQQYEIWQPRARYKLLADPAVESTKRLCCALRRSTRDDRILFHYNGHGVPKPTASGEIWVFNKAHTQYIPVSLYDLQSWLGSPCIYVYDCSAAGNIVASFDRFARQRDTETERRRQQQQHQQQAGHGTQRSQPPSATGSASSTPTSTHPSLTEHSAPMSDCIQLAACAANETLPMNPALPADLFSACLTTPIPMALRWFVLQSPMLGAIISPDEAMKLPGRLNDRRTPLGELNWIFTAVTDTIAWNVLPPALFKRLFRQDMVVAAMFRNFLLADRVMRSYKCTPLSSPALPPTHLHPMWQAWDFAVDMCIMQIPALLEAAKNELPLPYKASSFFADQLTAFEVWLQHGSVTKQPPEQLPIVLQVLLSQVHRMRALVLLSRFLDLGAWAVHLALSVGIFPYVLKLLQSPAVELRPVLIFIWARMLAVDHECAQDLVKDNGFLYFINVLAPSGPSLGSAFTTQAAPATQPNASASLSEHRAMCAFVISIFCRYTEIGKRACFKAGVAGACITHTTDPDPLLRQWCCLCLGELWCSYPDAKWAAIRDSLHERLFNLLDDPVPEVRAASLNALRNLIGDLELTEQVIHIEHIIAVKALTVCDDASPMVRRELVCLLSTVVHRYMDQFALAASTTLDSHQHWLPSTECDDRRMGRLTKQRHTGRRASALHSDSLNALTLADTTTPLAPDSSPECSPELSAANVVDDTMYSCVWYALLILASDSYRPIANIAAIVVDFIHDQLYDAGQVTTALSLVHPMDTIIPGSPGIGQDIPLTPNSARSLNMTLQASGNDSPHYSPNLDRRPQQPATLRLTSSLRRSASGTISALKNLYNFGYGITTGLSANDMSETLNGDPRVEGGVGHGGRTVSERVSSQRSEAEKAYGTTGIDPSLSGHETTAGTRPWSTAGAHTLRQLQPILSDDTRHGAGANANVCDNTISFKQLSRLHSSFFDWSCSYFLEPQTRPAEADEPGSTGYNMRLWRRSRNERVLYETAPAQDLATGARWDMSLGTIQQDVESRLMRFHTFEPHLIACDGARGISVWNWEEGVRLNSFWNDGSVNSRVTAMKLMNEEDCSLLAVGSDDGVVRIYRHYDSPSELELITGWNALGETLPSNRGSGLVLDWQQSFGTILAGGDARVIRSWDAAREICVQDFHTHSDSCITSITSDPMTSSLFIAGCGDGVIRVFDRRHPPRESLVITWNEHPAWVLNVVQQTSNQRAIVSSSMAGDIKLWDIRHTDAVMTIDTAASSMDVFEVHSFSAVMASSQPQGVTIWNALGERIGSSQASTSILGQRSTFASALTFHPRRPLLAASSDRCINLVGSDVRTWPLVDESFVSSVRMIDA